MISFHPSHEPVAWLTLVLIIVQIIIGALTGHIDTTLWTGFSTAIAGVGIRQSVWSPASHNGELAEAVANAIKEIDH